MSGTAAGTARLDALAAAARTGFAARFEAIPDGLWSAPGRVNLIGEHTDYNQGLALPLAIDRTTVAAAALRHDGQVRVSTVLEGKYDGVRVPAADISPGSVSGWAAYPLGVVWAFARRGFPVPGLDLQLETDVPVGAGLSSSAAVECAVAAALNDLLGARLGLAELATLCQQAENQMAGAPTGILDQTASLGGRTGHALLVDFRSGAARPVPLRLEEHALRLLVIDTKVSHAHAGGGYAERRRDCERAAEQLGLDSLRGLTAPGLDAAEARLDAAAFRRARHVVGENRRVEETVQLLEAADPAAIGPLLSQSHTSLRDDFEVSCPELDLAVDTACRHGALGARLTGGGFGGSAIALVPAASAAKVGTAVVNAFRNAGLVAPEIFPVSPAAGAARLA
ncbi:galactokinase [Arthrobacter crystallopoietes BAB-32]|uniref:Galactokinase n=1 Tax=Arthrobacter crystallopoietes BAB-32 TaxID=1246476 RepID=N1UV76_9MICC|nr:galactokinase [Arthrobacter crystallopoietes]EMY32960.1 galactokinase [Arthrobacter crystallopoietes BAB-32]